MLIGSRPVGHDVPRARRPVRGLLLAGRQALDLGTPRRPCSCSAARWPTSTPWSPRPGLVGGGRRAVRQHRVRLLPGVDARGSSSCSRCRRHGSCPTPSRSSPSRSASRSILTLATMATGVSSDIPRRDAARPVRALGRADHRGLHRGPLPDLLRRVRPADAHPAQRPVQPRRQLPRHRRPAGQLLALDAPDVPGGEQGRLPWRSATCVGVVAAHDRAIKLLPRRHQLTGQLPLLVAMVGFTVGGLYLLFAA